MSGKSLLIAGAAKAYERVRNRFDIDFKRPEVLIDDKHIFKNLRSLNDIVAASNVCAIFIEPNSIVFPTSAMAKYTYDGQHPNPPKWLVHDSLTPKDEYTLTHETAHSLILQLNRTLSERNIERLLNNDGTKTKGEVFSAFDEGLSDYIAIKTLENCGSPELESYAKERTNALESWLDKWLETNKRYRLKEEIDMKPHDLLLRHLKRNPGVLNCYKYEIGYLFVSRAKQSSLRKLTQNPPKSLEQLVYGFS